MRMIDILMIFEDDSLDPHVESFNDFEILSNRPCPRALNTASLHMHFSKQRPGAMSEFGIRFASVGPIFTKIIEQINNLFYHCE